MKVLVINCGSSSLKYQLIDMEGERVLCKGLCERIGIEGQQDHTQGQRRRVGTGSALPHPHRSVYEGR